MGELPVKNKGEEVELAGRASDCDTGLTPGKGEQEGNRTGQDELPTSAGVAVSARFLWSP